jgi:hypothetical protein
VKRVEHHCVPYIPLCIALPSALSSSTAPLTRYGQLPAAVCRVAQWNTSRKMMRNPMRCTPCEPKRRALFQADSTWNFHPKYEFESETANQANSFYRVYTRAFELFSPSCIPELYRYRGNQKKPGVDSGSGIHHQQSNSSQPIPTRSFRTGCYDFSAYSLLGKSASLHQSIDQQHSNHSDWAEGERPKLQTPRTGTLEAVRTPSDWTQW